jgi:hypothetical protein
MKRIVTLGMILLVALTGQAGELPTRDRLEADLRVRVELKSPKVIEAGTRPWVATALVNESKTAAHPVVRPGDGSEVGWREPHVYWTATLDRGDGKPVPVSAPDYGRCGLFAAGWPADARLLRPGDRVSLPEGPLPDFQQPRRVRLRAHYAYQAGGGQNSRSRVPPDQLGLMAGVPAFAVASDPVEFDVVRPLDVGVRVKGRLKVHTKARLSDLLEVTLANQSRAPVTCTSPTLHGDARLGLEIQGEFAGWRPSIDAERAPDGAARALKPGEAVPLLGPGAFANGLDGTWEYPVPGTVRVRAVYTTTTWKPGASIRSEWAEVRVEK